MFTNSYTQVFHTFTIIGLIAEFTLKLTKDIRSTIPENSIFETKVVAWSGLIVANISFSEVSLDLLDHYINAYLFVRLKLFLRSLIVWKIISVLKMLFLNLYAPAKFIISHAEAAMLHPLVKLLGTLKSGSRNTKEHHLEQANNWKKLCEPLWEITCLIATT